MKHIYFTPGPSQLYPGMEMFLQDAFSEEIGSLSHRSKKFKDILESLTLGLKELLNIPSSHTILYLSSATEGMERIIQNAVEKESLHVVTGAFGKRMYEIAMEMRKMPILHEVSDICDLSVERLPITKTTELICFTHTETGNGTALCLDNLYAQKKAHPDTLVALDVVSSTPYVDIDYSNIDIVFFSVQKGFGLPPGVGVVVLSPKALKKARELAQKGYYTGSFHSFIELAKHMESYQTPETPNTLGLFLFEKVVQAMLKKGIETIRKETNEKAALLYNYFEHHNAFNPVVTNKDMRSNTCIVIHTGDRTKELLEYIKSHNMIVGSGYGKMKDSQIRIANFPALSISDMKNLINCIHSFST